MFAYGLLTESIWHWLGFEEGEHDWVPLSISVALLFVPGILDPTAWGWWLIPGATLLCLIGFWLVKAIHTYRRFGPLHILPD